MHNFVLHSNESARRKSGCLGLEQAVWNMNIIRISYIDFYNHFKVKHVMIVRTHFLNKLPILMKAHPVVKKMTSSWKTSCRRAHMIIYFSPRFNIKTEVYNW